MAERLGASVWELEVAAITDLTPSLRQLTFACDSPESLTFSPGNDLTLAIATRDDVVVRRRYSIRRVDEANRTVDLQFVRHGDGPAAIWAENAEIGDRVEGVGPRGKIVVDPDAAWYLFAGDDAFLPAASAMIEAIPEGRPVFVAFEVDGPLSALPITATTQLSGPLFVYREGSPSGSSSILSDALSTFVAPDGRGMAYVGGEHKVVNALRNLLIERHVSPEQIAAKAYWRLGRANQDHGEPPREE
jgi:NADPH-dependent ferric siderophore reductase